MLKRVLRRVLERLSRGKVIRRRLPSAFGRRPIYVSPDAELKYVKLWGKVFDAELLRIACELVSEKSSVWDVGANVGIFSFAAASLARRGSVLAIEPDIWLVELLRRSARLAENRDLGIDILPAAISNRVGASTFLIANRGRASNALEEAGGRSQM
jgi:hypothetical protein